MRARPPRGRLRRQLAGAGWAVLPAVPALVAAVLAVVLAERGREPVEAALAGGCAGVLCGLAALDIRRGVIPNRLVYPALAAALPLSAAWPDRGVVESLVGGLGALAVALAVRALGRGALGGGDVKMAALVGVVVGSPGVLAAGLAAAITGGAAAAALLASRRVAWRERLPYGPFLAAGGVAALLL